MAWTDGKNGPHKGCCGVSRAWHRVRKSTEMLRSHTQSSVAVCCWLLVPDVPLPLWQCAFIHNMTNRCRVVPCLS